MPESAQALGLSLDAFSSRLAPILQRTFGKRTSSGKIGE
jgi:hypothetical protein